jgi:hypothetical protein
MDAKKPRAVTCFQTCVACPSQWEGMLDDGRMFYIRYRSGWLSAEVSEKPTTDVMDAVGAQSIYGAEHGDGLCGDMDTAEMKQHTAGVIDWGGSDGK